MGIELITPLDEVIKEIESRERRMADALVYAYKYVGERVIAHVRSLPSPNAADFPAGRPIPPHKPNYIDWTANLRNSIGYVIVVDGQVVDEAGFDIAPKGQDGAASGKMLAKSLISLYPKGIALIIVAGMHYASYVAAKGYDVIDSAEELADNLAAKLLSQIDLTP